MYLPSITVLLLVAQLNADSNIAGQLHQTCDGGYCLPKHLCPTGRANDVPTQGQNAIVTVRVGEANECGDFMKICCKEANRNSGTANNAVPRVNQKCGISKPQGLVYNVESSLTYAKYAEFPWTVAIFQMSTASNNFKLTHVGGGALIHPKFVLTAAHTLKTSHRYVARFGEWNMNSDAEIYPAQDIEVEKHIPHPMYSATEPPENDIALAKLKQNVIYSEHIRPLCLPSAQDVFDDQQCIVAGWGWDVRVEQPASLMKRIELNVVPHGRCEMLLWSKDLSYSLHSSVMCASAAGDQDTCIKDGGSPLACQRNDGSYVLAGITSGGYNCGRTNVPGFYVNVAKFARWINDTIERHDQPRAVKKINGSPEPYSYARSPKTNNIYENIFS